MRWDRPRSRLVGFGMPGDRSDEDLRRVGAALVGLDPDTVILREMPTYLRGRAPGEVPDKLAEGLHAAGFAPERVRRVDDELATLQLARTLAGPGDLIVVLLHSERDAVAGWLADAGAVPTELV